MDAEPIHVEAHVGWRTELGAGAPRVQAGLEARRAWLGVELSAGTRIGATPYSGHIAAQEIQPNDGSWFALRDDLVTGGLLVALRPWPGAAFGPALALGAEVASTQVLTFDGDFDGDALERIGPVPTAWAIARVGVEARVGHVGARLTVADRASVLVRPGQYEPGSPGFVDTWRVGVDLLVGIR